MKPRSVKTRFLKRLDAAGISLNDLPVSDGIDAMLNYYSAERVEGCDLEEDGDMLLFQWGTYDWGKGASFEVNITRQLIAASDEDDEPQQLSLTFQFDSAVGSKAGEGNQWCESPDGLAPFQRSIVASKALKAVGQQPPRSITLRFGRC
ncbi:MAG: hypothetical protein JWN70_6047 [Planctomycetaceae bacterium]|nr:hypothetical protein [Planctomycetaceae bacterium]